MHTWIKARLFTYNKAWRCLESAAANMTESEYDPIHGYTLTDVTGHHRTVKSKIVELYGFWQTTARIEP